MSAIARRVSLLLAWSLCFIFAIAAFPICILSSATGIPYQAADDRGLHVEGVGYSIVVHDVAVFGMTKPRGPGSLAAAHSRPGWASDDFRKRYRVETNRATGELSSETDWQEIAVGWPLRFLTHSQSRSGSECVDGILLGRDPMKYKVSVPVEYKTGAIHVMELPMQALRAIPLRVLWWRFAANVGAAMIAVGAIRWLVGSIVRRRRHSAGRCVRCGYDLSGISEGKGCPECGSKSSLVPRTT